MGLCRLLRVPRQFSGRHGEFQRWWGCKHFQSIADGNNIVPEIIRASSPLSVLRLATQNLNKLGERGLAISLYRLVVTADNHVSSNSLEREYVVRLLKHTEAMVNSKNPRKARNFQNMLWSLARLHNGELEKDLELQATIETIMDTMLVRFVRGSDPLLPLFDATFVAWAIATVFASRLRYHHWQALAAIWQETALKADDVPNRVWNVAWSIALVVGKFRSSALDGIWLDRGIIQGKQLRWSTGRVVELQDTCPLSCSLEHEGEVFHAQLEADGQKLVWNDGDQWTRETYHMEALDAIALVAKQKVDEMDAPSISNIAWAFGTVLEANAQQLHLDAVSVLAGAVRDKYRSGECEARHLSTVLGACARLQCHHTGIMREALDAGGRSDCDWAPRVLADVAQAITLLGTPDQAEPVVTCPLTRGFFCNIVVIVGRNRGFFNSQDMTQLAISFATAGLEDASFFKLALGRLRKQCFRWPSESLVEIAWATAKLRLLSQTISQGITVELIRRKLDKLESRALAKLCWSLAVAEQHHQEIFCFAFVKVDWLQSDTESLMQMYQVHLSTRLERRTWGLELPALVATRGRAVFAESAEQARPSSLQKQVSNSLRRLQYSCRDEFVTQDGLSIDIAMLAQRVAVEVDGPTHFLWSCCRSTALRPDGSTTFKRRLLIASGWQTVTISHADWDDPTLDDGVAEGGVSKSRLAFLRARLAQLLGGGESVAAAATASSPSADKTSVKLGDVSALPGRFADQLKQKRSKRTRR
eukprot:TRINITY_DN18014_c0_g1_i3.p1 TRINITY_DN18014_c0_g1~~TRINITY_DN18014_c0_g1_i3.p1  ORF type:complete len:760 (-),score=94.32 TRINITY_DN18014_c0_g1_i3:31-2310(-)